MDEPAVLIVGDDVTTSQWMATILSSWGMRTKSVTKSLLVPDDVERNVYDLVLFDVSASETNGLRVLPRIRELYPQAKVIVTTDEADNDTAITALRMGAFDFFKKSAPLDFFSYMVRRALQIQKMEEEHRQALAVLQQRQEGPQADIGRLGALINELREASQAVLVLVRSIIEQAQKDAEIRLMMRLQSLLQPLVRSLSQEREMAEYVTQLETVFEVLAENPESSVIHTSLMTTLSVSELRIALMIKDGMTSDEIAERLYISPETVKSHRKNIRKKLGLRGSRKRLRTYFDLLGEAPLECEQG